MYHAITIGDVASFVLVGGGIVLVLAILIYILSRIGDGFSH